jgi:hypothetical protein
MEERTLVNDPASAENLSAPAKRAPSGSRKQSAKQKRGAAIGWPLALAYLGSLLLTVLALLLVLQTTICSAAFLKGQVKSSRFADAAYSFLADNYTSYGAATGFSAEVMTGFLSRDQIEADMQASVDALYAGNTEFDERTAIQDAANTALAADLQTRNVEMTDDLKSAVNIVADACRADYASYVSVPLASQLYTLVTKLDRVLWIGMILAAGFAACATLLMLRLAGHPDLGVRCLCFEFSTAALLCGLAAFAVFPLLHLDRLSIHPTSIRLLLIASVRGIFSQFAVFLLIYGAAAAVLIFLMVMARSAARRRVHHNDTAATANGK